MDILTIDFSQEIRDFKPINGVTNGPGLHRGALDSSRYFQELDLPLSRLHDTELLSPRPFVDYYRIFSDIARDENDPTAYNFRNTDRLIEKLEGLGIDIIFRLGNSATVKNVDNHASFPCSVEKLSTVMCRIAEHYCAGWADGYTYRNISFELWNEPDLVIFYSGTEDAFHRFYELSAAKIKRAMPEVKVGGCAFSDALSAFAEHWLDFVRDRGCPLDFFSYHYYNTSPAPFRERSARVREMLDERGFTAVPTVVDEWNFNINFGDRLNESYTHIGRIAGACFTASMLAELQRDPVDFATYYDMQSNYMMLLYNGIYYFNGFKLVNKKPYYAFLYFKYLKELGRETYISELPGVYTLAASDGRIGRAMITNYSFEEPAARDIALRTSGAYSIVHVYMTDKKHTNKLVYSGRIPEIFTLAENAMYYLEFEQ